MKYVDLSQHIHELRAEKTGRAIGRGMRVAEVWDAALASPKNDISFLKYFEADLPDPFDGIFVRLQRDGESGAVVYVRRTLEVHWKEFVAIKELMHCWSPVHTWEGTPSSTKLLVKALTRKDGRYTPNVAADSGAVSAAAEVILPHTTVERHLEQGHDFIQIAMMHGLHEEVVEMICRHDFLHHRKNGSLGGD
jgi:hypothetical protein